MSGRSPVVEAAWFARLYEMARAGSIVPTLGGNESEFQAQWKRAVFTPSMYMLDDLADVEAATGCESLTYNHVSSPDAQCRRGCPERRLRCPAVTRGRRHRFPNRCPQLQTLTPINKLEKLCYLGNDRRRDMLDA